MKGLALQFDISMLEELDKRLFVEAEHHRHRINMSAILVMWLRLTLKPEYLVTGEMRMKLSEL